MSIFRKILLFFIIIIVVYLLYRLICKRSQIISTPLTDSIEGLTTNTIKKPIKLDGMDSLNMVNTSNTSNRLVEYCIKASSNSAFNKTKNSIDLDMLNIVIARGCRFLDFEIYNIQNEPVVGISTTNSFSLIECQTTISFNDILYFIASNAFVSTLAPNPNDPLFIQLRIKSKDTIIYSLIAKYIQKNFSPNILINGLIDINQPLSFFGGKVIFIIDKTQTPSEYLQISNCKGILEECILLEPYVNIEMGTPSFPSTNQSQTSNTTSDPLHVNSDGITTNISKLKLFYPDIAFIKSKSNPSYYSYVKDLSVQILPMCFFIVDDSLKKYEKMFVENGNCAFVPMSKVMSYINYNGFN